MYSRIILLFLFSFISQISMSSNFDINTKKIIGAKSNQEEWITHGRTYSEERFSGLKQINEKNVSNLGIEWFHDLDSSRGHEATPLVVNGVMFSTGAWSVVFANDASTGELIWKYDPQVPREKAYYLCCDAVNRGVAIWEGKIYLGTLDGRLIALDAKNGALIWEKITVEDSKGRLESLKIKLLLEMVELILELEGMSVLTIVKRVK